MMHVKRYLQHAAVSSLAILTFAGLLTGSAAVLAGAEVIASWLLRITKPRFEISRKRLLRIRQTPDGARISGMPTSPPVCLRTPLSNLIWSIAPIQMISRSRSNLDICLSNYTSRMLPRSISRPRHAAQTRRSQRQPGWRSPIWVLPNCRRGNRRPMICLPRTAARKLSHCSSGCTRRIPAIPPRCYSWAISTMRTEIYRGRARCSGPRLTTRIPK